MSYGAYQLSTKMGTLNEYLHQSRYGEAFHGLVAGTPPFDAKWRALAKTDPGFAKDQHDFVGRSHYDEQLKNLNAAGIGLADRGRAMQDAIWSTSVQFRGLTPRIFVEGIAEKYGKTFELSNLTDSQIIEAVQDYKIAHSASLFKSSPEWQPGLLKRANQEKKDLLKLDEQERLVGSPSIERRTEDAPSVATKGHNAVSRGCGELPHIGGVVERVRALQTDLRKLGYSDSHGRPLVPDGVSGPNTLHAIKSFQRAHHLHVDGIVGRHTLAALEDARRWPLLSEATHPQHRLYAQLEQGIRKLPSHGRSDEREIENAAVALTIAAHTSGLRQVDHIVLGSNGVNLFAVQGRMDDPGHRRVHVELAHAVSHAMDHRSMVTAQPAPEHLHSMAVAQQQSAPRPPVMTSP